MKITPRNREIREKAYTDFIYSFFGIRGLPKVYGADDVYFFYCIQAKKVCPVIYSRAVFLKKMRLCEIVDSRVQSRRVYFYSVGNEDCPIFYNMSKEKPVSYDTDIKEFADYLRWNRKETYLSRAAVYELYKTMYPDPLGRNAFYNEMRKITPEGHGKTRYFCIKKTKIIEK
jgi:hypothetical protein